MFEMKITIDITPALGNTLNRVADALSGQVNPALAPVVFIDGQAVGQAESAPAAQVPVAQAPAAPVPAVPVAPPPAPVPAVPVAQSAAPTYTKEQVASAGAALIQSRPDTRDALIGLLAQYGVNAINNLPDEHLGAFATALRQLGANI